MHTAMEIIEARTGSHAVASPCGCYVASVAEYKVNICDTRISQTTTQWTSKIHGKDVAGLKWSFDSALITVCSAKHAEVFDLDDFDRRVRLDNGGGGLGRFASADFIGSHQLLTTWEFGRAKLWDLETGKGVELGDVKTTGDGQSWALRPSSNAQSVQTLAVLSREGAEDVLMMYFPNSNKSLPPVKLPTTDAQSIQWSPDGRWLTVLDTPTAPQSLHLYTPDNHLFRSFPRESMIEDAVLSVKTVTWSPDSTQLAVSHYDGRITLLNTRTFAPKAIIEHNTIINQTQLRTEHRAPIWEEVITASRERSYVLRNQPVPPPLSRLRPSTEPIELGVAEACFNSDAKYLATRDERMRSTVWIWNMQTLAAHAVLIQHGNVRKMQWHPTRPDILLLDSGESTACQFNADTCDIPVAIQVHLRGTPTFSWLPSRRDAKSAILCASKTSFSLLYPEGRDQALESAHFTITTSVESAAGHLEEEGDSEDSVMDLLSGRKPLPPKTEASYTEMVDLEVGAQDDYDDSGERLEDTFRAKQVQRDAVAGDETNGGLEMEMDRDPLDDSDIF